MRNLNFFLPLLFFIRLCAMCTYAQTSQCRLASTVSNNVAIGFRRISSRVKSVGEIIITVLFVDFSDAPASQTPQDVYTLISPTTEDFIAQTSYSKLKVTFVPNYKWLRMSKTSDLYGMTRDLTLRTQGEYMYDLN